MCPKARSGTRLVFCRKAARVRTKPKKANEMSRLGGEGRAAEHRRRSRGAELLAGVMRRPALDFKRALKISPR